MPWNNHIFRQQIEAAAAAVNKTPTAAFAEAGLATSSFGTQRDHGPRIDILEKLMPALNWTAADVHRVIAACFEWRMHDGEDISATISEVAESVATQAAHPGQVRAIKGEISITLKNVEIRVLSAD